MKKVTKRALESQRVTFGDILENSVFESRVGKKVRISHYLCTERKTKKHTEARRFTFINTSSYSHLRFDSLLIYCSLQNRRIIGF